jgi:hypothetical protein
MKKIILSIIALLSVTVMEAQKNQTHLTLNNGVAIPQFGLRNIGTGLFFIFRCS